VTVIEVRRKRLVALVNRHKGPSMNAEKKKRLERSGWAVGDTAAFLNLSPEEARFIELKLALAGAVRELRERQGLTQAALATRLGSSQSRVAKMEAGDRSVSLDLLVKSLLTIGASSAEIAKWIKRAETTRAD
jgi:predicted XRE-type DNA-binding protein